MFKSALLGLTLLAASFFPAMAQTSECMTPPAVHQMIVEANPDENLSNHIIMTGKRAQWFRESYQTVLGQTAPEFDTLSLYSMSGVVIVVGFLDGCAVGAARLPLSAYVAIRNEMEKNRAASE